MSSDKRNDLAEKIKEALLKQHKEGIISMGIHSRASEDYKKSHLWHVVQKFLGDAYTVVNTPKELWKVLVWLYADSEANLMRYVERGNKDKIRDTYQLRINLASIALQNDSCITELLKADESSVSQWLLNIPTMLTSKTKQYAGYTNNTAIAGGMSVAELLSEFKSILTDLLWTYFKSYSEFGNTCIGNPLVESELSKPERINDILTNKDTAELLFFIEGSDATITSALKVNNFDNTYNLAIKLHNELTSKVMNEIKTGTSEGAKFLNNENIRQALTRSSTENANFMRDCVAFDKDSRHYVVKAA